MSTPGEPVPSADTASHDASFVGDARVFSGVQPTGSLHLGNYLGAIRKFVELQRQMQCLFCIVDMHSITVWQDPKLLRKQTFGIAAAYLAAGVDPKQGTVFVQSQVSAHAELAWIFNCIARLGWLSRMTQFKDKAGKDKERASVGLFAYPSLMAADILAYKATHVPVGEDQKQHLELARDIAGKFNNDYGVAGFFPLPEPLIKGAGARVMSLRDGRAKMSKSDPSDNSRINMQDDADTIARKFKKAKSDPDLLPETMEGLEGRPEAENLVGIFAALSGAPVETVLADFAGKGFGALKPALAGLAVEKLSPIAAEMVRLRQDEAYLEDVLKQGAESAAAIAAPILKDIKEIVGFIV